MLKKLFSLVLAMSLLTALLFPASAATTISPGKGLSIHVTDDEIPVILQFIPTKTGYYHFYSYQSTGYDPSGYIMDADWDLLADGDDTENGLDFSIRCYMTAGKTYYLAATCYAGSAAYTVQIDALATATSIAFDQSSYTGSLRGMLYPQILFYPEGCAEETVTFTTSGGDVVSIGDFCDLYLGIPGTATVTATTESGLTATCTVTVQAPEDLIPDTPRTLDAARGEQYLQFIAPESGWYGISSSGDEIDPWVEILDENLMGLGGDDNALSDENFFAPVYLEATQLCYFGFDFGNRTGTTQVTLQRLALPDAIALPHDSVTGYVDTACQLTPVYAPKVSIPENLTWRSSNEQVASVDATGSVSFIQPGTAVITMISETGKTDSTTVTVLPAPASTGLLDWGICGPNLQWQLSSTGVLTITGSGDMYDRDNNLCHWDHYNHRITQVVFPEGITSIGAYTFADCYNLAQVAIPNSVLRIGSTAFANCTALTKVTLPKELDWLGGYAFDGCISLKQVNLPENLKRVPALLFHGCYSLSQITIPETVVSIGDDAFCGCSMEELLLPAGLKTLGNSALAATRLTELSLPNGLTELRDYALVNCRLENLTIPATVTKIGCGFVSGNELCTLRFLGHAPEFAKDALSDLEITAYYPAGDPTWTEEVRQNYGGTVTWIAKGEPGVLLSGTLPDGVTLTFSGNGDNLILENGGYCFYNLQPGTYTLTATADNHVTRIYRITVDSSNVTQDVVLHLTGDIDGNGKINVGDVSKLTAHIKGTASFTDDYILECANVNGGKLNMGDVSALYAHIKGTKPLY